VTWKFPLGITPVDSVVTRQGALYLQYCWLFSAVSGKLKRQEQYMNSHVLGFPRVGSQRELKRGIEKFWKGQLSEKELVLIAEELKEKHWNLQSNLDMVATGDFSFYDQMLDTIAMLGAVPPRFEWGGQEIGLDTYFKMARGDAPQNIPAMEMTKWFDANYHYIVPEFTPEMTFKRSTSEQIEAARHAKACGFTPKPVLIGPVTFLMLGKEFDGCCRWKYLDAIVDVYAGVLEELSEEAPWIQIDEPVLCLDLPEEARSAFPKVYNKLSKAVKGSHLLLATYFGELGDNLDLTMSLPFDALHVDLVRGGGELKSVIDSLPLGRLLSLGVIDGRNIWKNNLKATLALINPAVVQLGSDKLMVASSCSLLHCPVDLEFETDLPLELRDWMAFAVQKCEELAVLRDAVNGSDVSARLAANADSMAARDNSSLRVNLDVRASAAGITPQMMKRESPFERRIIEQQGWLNLPVFPTTTIGSFPQTTEIRNTRLDYKKGVIDKAQYNEAMRKEILHVIDEQDKLGLDVYVHGEPERNDMVEYFGQQMKGFCFTKNGWVQSYGSRCVKPPIIYGDVFRPEAMTVDWIKFAQNNSSKPMKGMLTGPVTMLCWSFVRDDLSREDVCRQIALAIREEVLDLEAAGIKIIQIDEAALREGMPLRASERDVYLQWAVDCFKITSSGVGDDTQIHSHMCYSEFNTIAKWIARMDADVISIEASRSGMDLLQAFKTFEYPNDIGPGVYDIHSPRVPSEEEIYDLLKKAIKVIKPVRLWVNPDCGLKTRDWPETRESLANMVAAAKRLREEFS